MALMYALRNAKMLLKDVKKRWSPGHPQLEGMVPNSSWQVKLDQSFSEAFVLASAETTSTVLPLNRSTPASQVRSCKNYIDLTRKKDHIAAMHMFFMLLSSVTEVCFSIKFPVSLFLEFLGVGLGRPTTPSTGLWILGALSRVM